MVIARAIKKYGVENFKFEVLYKNIPIEEIDELEIRVIEEKNCRVPNGYNVACGGNGNKGVQKFGAENSNAHLTEEEATYILNNRNKPLYVLYSDFSDKLSYCQFKKIYHHQTYTNIHTDVEEYPYNFEFSCQFNTGKLEYDEVISLRERYANGEYWRNVYKDFKEIYTNEWSFWRVYNGESYPLVMPEVFTVENRKKHSSIARQGENNGRAKLKAEDVLNIRKLHEEGISNSELYKIYPQVTPTSIRAIINKLTWKNLL